METETILSSVTMKDLTDYFRSRDGGSHNRRFAEKLARVVNQDPDKSKTLLPPGWHIVLHPPQQSFIRRLGFDPFAESRGGGTQIVHRNYTYAVHDKDREQENGPDALSPKNRIEAV